MSIHAYLPVPTQVFSRWRYGYVLSSRAPGGTLHRTGVLPCCTLSAMSTRIGQFIKHGLGNHDLLIQSGQNVDGFALDKVVERAGVGDNDTHLLSTLSFARESCSRSSLE